MPRPAEARRHDRGQREPIVGAAGRYAAGHDMVLDSTEFRGQGLLSFSKAAENAVLGAFGALWGAGRPARWSGWRSGRPAPVG